MERRESPGSRETQMQIEEMIAMAIGNALCDTENTLLVDEW